MAKPKSNKLRLLETLRFLYKETDAEHPATKEKLNEYLRNYDAICQHRVMTDTIRTLQKFGIDARRSGTDRRGSLIWIENRPISDENIDQLIYGEQNC